MQHNGKFMIRKTILQEKINEENYIIFSILLLSKPSGWSEDHPTISPIKMSVNLFKLQVIEVTSFGILNLFTL